MIEYRFKEEKEIALHYAKVLGDDLALKFINEGSVDSKKDVEAIAKFYWDMVDLNIQETQSNSGKYSDMEKWLERIYTSFHIYFNNNGFGDIWENAIP